MKTSTAALVVVLAAGFVACGGSTFSNGGADGGTPGPNANDGGSFDSGANDGSPGGDCPANVPAAKNACSPAGLSCEYGGTGDHLLCSTMAECQPSASGGNQWFVNAPAASCVASPSQNPLGCPPTFGTIPTGASCPREPASDCVYPEGTCGCVSCAPDGGGTIATEWVCDPWPTPNGCPEPRPRIGSPCASEGQSCMYADLCSVGNGQPAMGCQNGRWVLQAFGVDCAIRHCGM
jgi:hypothetical protein